MYPAPAPACPLAACPADKKKPAAKARVKSEPADSSKRSGSAAPKRKAKQADSERSSKRSKGDKGGSGATSGEVGRCAGRRGLPPLAWGPTAPRACLL